MARDGYDPVPTYTAPRWSEQNEDEPLETEQVATQSLVCISPPAHSFLNSSFGNVDRLQKREKMPFLRIHSDDARVRQIGDGARVRVWNELGSVTLTAEVTEDIIPGTVLAPGVWWTKFSPDGRNINQIVSAQETDMGAGATFYDTRVWVEANAEGETQRAPQNTESSAHLFATEEAIAAD